MHEQNKTHHSCQSQKHRIVPGRGSRLVSDELITSFIPVVLNSLSAAPLLGIEGEEQCTRNRSGIPMSLIRLSFRY